MKPLRILLVDDSRLFRAAAAEVLSCFAGVEIVGQAESATEAITKIPEILPDLVLMDISMPQMNGIEATERIKASPNAPLVVLVTLHNDSKYRAAAQAAGADGFIVKDQFLSSIEILINQFQGGRSESPDVASNPTFID